MKNHNAVASSPTARTERRALPIMPKTHRHLFEQMVSLPNLFAAARDALRGKRSRGPAAAFYGDLEREVVDPRNELREGVYQQPLLLEPSRQTGTGMPIVVTGPNPAGPSRLYRVRVE